MDKYLAKIDKKYRTKLRKAGPTPVTEQAKAMAAHIVAAGLPAIHLYQHPKGGFNGYLLSQLRLLGWEGETIIVCPEAQFRVIATMDAGDE